jgi:hypothetical protein
MTEAEWLACDDLERMLTFLRGKLTERQIRLMDCACCRRIWNRLTDPRSRHAVEIAEQFADYQASLSELQEACWAGINASQEMSRSPAFGFDCWTLARAAYECAVNPDLRDGWGGHHPSSHLPIRATLHVGEQQEEMVQQCRLLRDIFGNPYRTLAFKPPWRTDTVLAMAHLMYNSRDFSAMPILADALQDAGCDNTEILDHCRGPGPHVRGCWVVDLVLGKE